MDRILVTGGSGFIGTNLMESLLASRKIVLNYDTKRPSNSVLGMNHVLGNILDLDRLSATMRAFNPDAVVHLAARCDLGGASPADYVANTQGVQNVISASQTGSVKRVLFASSRYVHETERQPARDDIYSPFTAYGASKAEGERLVRASGLDIPWLIFRPTSIWGPWFDTPYKGFFTAVRKGLYVHPQGQRILKSYGYVGNVVHQIRRFLTAADIAVKGRTFYTADYAPIEIRTMAECIRKHFGAPRIREVPVHFLKPIARVGDLLKTCGWSNPPLTSFRLNNLLCPMDYDLANTKQVAGELPYSMEQGVARTVDWMLN
jgi:nucleoside-diphosphate-sugar epimerase